MSLVPYSSRDSREIVLRYDDAIVIRDPQSKQLILRGTSSAGSKLNECPYCHQSLRSSSPERETRSMHGQERFVSPEYFRMLHLANDSSDDGNEPPSSPIRRLVQPLFPFPRSPQTEDPRGAEFVTSIPAEPKASDGQGIKRDAFSPNYFTRFFTEEKELGRGGKGVVLLVKHELDGVFLGHFACKRVPVGDDHAWLEKVLIEVQLLQRLSHPNLVSYRHVWLEDVKLNRFGPSVPCAFILQQYCNAGDLLHYVVGSGPSLLSTNEQLKEQLRRRSKGQSERPSGLRSSQRRLSFEEIYSFFKDITSGLAHLHGANYIHRDLKPSNCLLHKTGSDIRCLISDFGEVQEENIVRKSTGATGTISYCAPEVLRRDASGRYGEFSTKSDIFSLGMILYFMCFGRLPYSSADAVQEEFEDLDLLRAEISAWSGFQDERQERPDLPDQLYDFLKRLLALDPIERPSAGDILHALRTESGLQSPLRGARGGSSSHVGLGRRIQSLDSPMPGSPALNSGRVLSSAQLEGGEEDRSPLSSREPTPTSPPPKDLSETADEQRGRSPSVNPPLLLPPPSTRLDDLKNRIAVYRHHVNRWAHLNQQVLILAAKLLLFIFKVYALMKPCSPLATKPLFSYPLLLLAAVDLGLGGGLSWRITGLLTVVHFSALVAALGRGELCVLGEPWDWNGDAHSSPYHV
ncbi:MAG: putative serine/threonine-protein kinase iks1 [Claussenomyces sp. TS43310]|nr:MAG: putative serine/threonine-protein kinase iks1 [Claussenomyces sp. TS43310]